MELKDIGSGFLPYVETVNRDYDSVYRFQWKGTQVWDVTITIDGLNDDLIVEKNCGCPARQKFRKNEDCKHILAAKRELKRFGVQYRENELCEQKQREIQTIATVEMPKAC